jgi:hypothetical protein
MAISELELQMMQARLARSKFFRTEEQQGAQHLFACERESELHQQIEDYCRQNGWITLHGSMAHKTYRTKGECDFCCLLPNGRVIFVECKTGSGKLSPEQNAMRAWMEKLKHTMHVVREFSQFVQLTRECLQSDSANSLSCATPEAKTEGLVSNANVTAASKQSNPLPN